MYISLVDGVEGGREEGVGGDWLLPSPCRDLNFYHVPLSPVHSPPPLSPLWSFFDDPYPIPRRQSNSFQFLLDNEPFFIDQFAKRLEPILRDFVRKAVEDVAKKFLYSPKSLIVTLDSTKPSKAVEQAQQFLLEGNAINPDGSYSTEVLLECNRELIGGDMVIDLRREVNVYEKSDNHHFNCINHINERAVSGQTTQIQNEPLFIDPIEVVHSAKSPINAIVTIEPDPAVEQVPGFGQTDPLSLNQPPEELVMQDLTSLDLRETCEQTAIAKHDLQAQSILELNEIEGFEGQGISPVIQNKRKISLCNTSASSFEYLQQHSTMSVQEATENVGEGQMSLLPSVCHDNMTKPSDCSGTSLSIEIMHGDDTITKLVSEQQKSMEDFEAINEGGGTYEATINQKKRRVSTSKIVITKPRYSLKILQQHRHKTEEEAAKSLGVSKSTLKRECRLHGIPSWFQFRRRKKCGSASEAKGMSILTEQSNIVNGSSQIPAIPNLVPDSVNPVLEAQYVTIMAKYGDKTLKFKLPYLSEMEELEEQVAKRLKLEVGSFSIEYEDENGELIFLAISNDLHDCISDLTSLGKTKIKMFVKSITS